MGTSFQCRLNATECEKLDKCPGYFDPAATGLCSTGPKVSRIYAQCNDKKTDATGYYCETIGHEETFKRPRIETESICNAIGAEIPDELKSKSCETGFVDDGPDAALQVAVAAIDEDTSIWSAVPVGTGSESVSVPAFLNGNTRLGQAAIFAVAVIGCGIALSVLRVIYKNVLKKHKLWQKDKNAGLQRSVGKRSAV